jgi:hypothetical protein
MSLIVAAYYVKSTVVCILYVVQDESHSALHKIFEPIKCKEEWGIRSNNELRKVVTGKGTVNYVKTQRIKMWGHPDRMEDIKLVENITVWNPIGVRTKGRTNNRWRESDK